MGCWKMQVLNPPEGLKNLDNGTLWISGASEITTISRKEELDSAENIKIDGVFELQIDQAAAKLLIHDKWCPGSIWRFQEPYKIRLWANGDLQPQRLLYCIGKNDANCTYSVSVGWDKSHWAIAFNDCDLCDVMKKPQVNIIDGNTYDTCITQILGDGFVDLQGTGFTDVWQQACDTYYYNDGDDGIVFLPAWYGGTYYGNQLTLEDFRPWFNFLWVLQNGARVCGGWCIKAPIFENELFRRALVYILSNEYGNTDYAAAFGGNIQSAFDDCTYKAVVPTGDILSDHTNVGANGNCVQFPSIINDASAQIAGGAAQGTTFGIKRNLIQGFCLRFKLIMTEADWKGDVTFSILQQTGLTAGSPYTLPNGTTINAVNSTTQLLESGTFSLDSTTEDGNVIIEGTVEVECVNFIDCPTLIDLNLFTNSLVVCIDGNPSELPAAPVPEFTVEYFEAFNKPKRFKYRRGDVMNLCRAVTCDKSFLDYFKGAIDMIDGKIVTDFATKTICIYPPVTVEMPDGEEIEGYDNGQPPIDFNEFIICNSHAAQAITNDQARLCRLGFAKSTDSYIQSLYEGDDQPFDYVHDLGEQFENRTVDKRNPFFEPTILKPVQGITCNGVPVYLPNLSDNEDGEVSYDIGCRIVLGNKAEAQFWQNSPEITYCETDTGTLQQTITKVKEFVLGYQSLAGINNFTLLNAAYNTAEILSYDPNSNLIDTVQWDFFNLFHRKGRLAVITGDVHSFDFFICNQLPFDYRRRAKITYEGKRYLLNPSEVSASHCARRGTIIGRVPSAIDAACLGTTPTTGNTCNNSASIVCTPTEQGDIKCYDIVLTGNIESPILSTTWCLEELQADGSWGSPQIIGGTPTGTQVCDLQKVSRVQAKIKFSPNEDGITCPDIATNYCVLDPCGNIAEVIIDCYPHPTLCQNCIKITIDDTDICSEIESITALIDFTDKAGNTVQQNVTIDPTLLEIEVCSDWVSANVLNVIITYVQECPPHIEPPVLKVLPLCCFEPAGDCQDCLYKFDDTDDRKIIWYKIKAARDQNTVPYGLTADIANINNEVKEEIKCSYPIYGPYGCEFEDKWKGWYIAIMEDPTGECECILFPYYHKAPNAGDSITRIPV